MRRRVPIVSRRLATVRPPRRAKFRRLPDWHTSGIAYALGYPARLVVVDRARVRCLRGRHNHSGDERETGSDTSGSQHRLNPPKKRTRRSNTAQMQYPTVRGNYTIYLLYVK